MFFQDGFERTEPGRLPAGWTGDGQVVADQTDGTHALFVADVWEDRYAAAYSGRFPIRPGVVFEVASMVRTDDPDAGGARIAIGVEEYDGPPEDDTAKLIVVKWLYCVRSMDWRPNATKLTTTNATHSLRLRILPAGGGADKQGRAWFDDIELSRAEPDPPAVIDGFGNPVPVTDIEDVPKILTPKDFWARPPKVDIDPDVARRSIWSYRTLRRHFFGQDMGLPKRIHDFHAAMPQLDHTIGVLVDIGDELMQSVVALDIQHHPIVRAHPAATGSYSKNYYPRRMHDWLGFDFLPAYNLTEEAEFGDQMVELLEFLAFSQYDDSGDNAFTARYFPAEFEEAKRLGRTKQWTGGWDYVYDWEWLDAFNYLWRLHAADHHVGAQCAATIARAYELTGRRAYFDAVVRFVDQMVPRYGWHAGTWEGRRYYWTEYNPSGPENSVRDAVDNVVALVAQAVAAVGFYTDDRRKLELARGMLWYLVREWTTDGRWYYDGAENPRNQRRAVSHDMAVLLPFQWTAAYLLKAGVRLDRELETLDEAYEFYLENYPYWPLGDIRNGQVAKVPPFRHAGDAGWKVTSYFTANRVSRDVTLHDVPPTFTGASAPDGRLEVRASKLVPPSEASEPWRLDDDTTQIFLVTRQELADGLPTGWTLQPGDAVRFTYRVTGGGEWEPLRPSSVGLTDPNGQRLTVTGTVPDPAYPTTVTDETFPAFCARLNVPIGPEHSGRVQV